MCEHVHAQPPLGAGCGAERCQSAQAGGDEGADTDGRDMDGRDMDGRGRHGHCILAASAPGAHGWV